MNEVTSLVTTLVLDEFGVVTNEYAPDADSFLEAGGDAQYDCHTRGACDKS